MNFLVSWTIPMNSILLNSALMQSNRIRFPSAVFKTTLSQFEDLIFFQIFETVLRRSFFFPEAFTKKGASVYSWKWGLRSKISRDVMSKTVRWEALIALIWLSKHSSWEPPISISAIVFDFIYVRNNSFICWTGPSQINEKVSSLNLNAKNPLDLFVFFQVAIVVLHFNSAELELPKGGVYFFAHFYCKINSLSIFALALRQLKLLL